MAEAVKKLTAQYINLESSRKSIITVTRTEILNRGKEATIYFTALPESEEKVVLEFLKRHASKLRKFILSKKVVGYAPKMRFVIDTGEHNRQRIDQLLIEDQDR